MSGRLFAKIITLLVVTCLACGLLLPAELFARAGGGEGFGDGGGGGSGDGIAIEVLLELIYWSSRLCFEYPKVGIPLLLALILLVIFACKEGANQHVSRTIRKGIAVREQHDLKQTLAALRDRDPGFDIDRFLDRVAGAFRSIQQAWSDQEMKSVRAFISDGIFERFALQIEMQQTAGYRNRMQNVLVMDRRIVAAETDEQFDTLHVRLRASAEDDRVDLKTGEPTGDAATRNEFVEYWSFHRRLGARTRTEPGNLEGRCPHCGAPVEIVDRAVCGACQSVVNSGEYDWVLTEITQEGEWQVPAEIRFAPGLERLQKQDPEFAPQHVEDRASVMFWRLRAAEFFGEPDRARPVITDRLAEEITPKSEIAKRKFWKDPAVGKVELIDVDLAPGSEFDRLRVHVRWSGIQCEGDPRGEHSVVRPKEIFSEVYVLIRKAGVGSDAEAVFSSASCGSCGAPVAASQEAACPYCEVNLTDGRYDWVLDAFERFTPAQAFRERPLPGESSGKGRPEPLVDPELSLAVLARIMVSDENLDAREYAALQAVAERRGLTDEQLQAVLDSARDEDVSLPVPKDARQAARFLGQLVAAGLVDGKISSSERRLLQGYAREMDLAPADVDLEINRQRGRLFQESKDAIRQAKRDRKRDERKP